MLAELQDVRHINTITHDGKVLVFATTGDRKIWYIVRRDGFEQTASAHAEWEDAKELPLPGHPDPSESLSPIGRPVEDSSVTAKERREQTYPDKDGNVEFFYLARSRYQTSTATEDAPVQLVSGMGYLYIFRQDRNRRNLLVDRFVLDGMTNTLNRKLQVRYKRSRQRYKPLAPPPGSSPQDLYRFDWDSLDFRDSQGKYFYEPTTELSLVRGMQSGWFSVVLLPTDEHDRFRWHIFAYHAQRQRIVMTSIAASEDGLFAFKDGRTPAVIRHELALRDSRGPLEISGAPVATKYDVQHETLDRRTAEPLLLRHSTRILLAVPTNRGIASLSLAASSDGTLAHPSGRRMSQEILRAEIRDILLPLNTLDKVRALADQDPAIRGSIRSVRRGGRDQVEVSPDGIQGDWPQGRSLQAKISEMPSIDGVYTVRSPKIGGRAMAEVFPQHLILQDPVPQHLPKGTRLLLKSGERSWSVVVAADAPVGDDVVGDDLHPSLVGLELGRANFRFIIPIETADIAEAPNGSEVLLADVLALEGAEFKDLGKFEVLPDTHSLIFDGAITGYSVLPDGGMGIQAVNHGLQEGDSVQITGTRTYNGIYPIRRVDNDHFLLEAPWKMGQAVNLSLLSRKRRGIVVNGAGDYLQIPARNYLNPERFTLEVWLSTRPGAGAPETGIRTVINKKQGASAYPFQLDYDAASGQLIASRSDGDQVAQVRTEAGIRDGRFHHVAVTADSEMLSIYLDGELQQTAPDLTSGAPASSAPVQIAQRDPHRGLEGFVGMISEVRLWNRARSGTDIRQQMVLSLSGSEEGLLGCWQMGGILEGNSRTVVDRSRFQNHAAVQGHAYVSGRELPAALGENLEFPVVEYLNEATFPVTGGATYRESFEFIPAFRDGVEPDPDDPQAMLAAIGAPEQPIFQFVYKGKRSRQAESWRTLSSKEPGAGGGSGESTTLPCEYLGDFRYRVQGVFTVPEDITLMRSFGLGAVNSENWTALSIFNHRIQQVADATTLQHGLHTLTLPDGHGLSSAHEQAYSEFADLEVEQSGLLLEMRHLEQKKRGLIRFESTKDDHRDAKDRVEKLQSQAAQARSDYQRERDDPLNYVCRIKNVHSGGYLSRGDVFKEYVEAFASSSASDPYSFWRFEKSGSSYSIRNMGQVDQGKSGYMERGAFIKEWVLLSGSASSAHSDGGLWTLEPSQGSYTIRNKANMAEGLGSVLGVYETYRVRMLERTPSSSKTEQLWQLLPERNRQAPNQAAIDAARRTWDARLSKLSAAQREERRLAALLPADMSKRALQRAIDRVVADIQTVNGKLQQIAVDLGQKRQEIMGQLSGALDVRDGSSFSPELWTDQRGLRTRGVLLAGLRAAGPLSLSEAGDGMVQLSFLDRAGRIRQVNYDAVADTRNNRFEAWEPERSRQCLDFGRDSSAVNIAEPIPLPGEWTMEAWFYHPIPADARYGLSQLIGGPDGQGHLWVGKDFSTSQAKYWLWHGGYDTSQLTPGWHHIAAVGLGQAEESTTLFYLDGELVGDAKQHMVAEASQWDKDRTRRSRGHPDFPVVRLGNRSHYQAGKMAEIRIWGVALSAEEIRVNSKTLLSGEEPGLLAYYPLNGDARDHGPEKKYHGEIVDADFVPCTAPIGRPAVDVLQFDGMTDYLEMEPFSLPERGTLEVWVKFDHLEDQILVDGGSNFRLELKDEDFRLVLGGRALNRPIDVDKSVPLDGQWHHLAATWQFGERFRIWTYVDGRWDRDTYEGDRTDIRPPAIHRIRIGRSSQSSYAHFRGHMAELRLWGIRRRSADFKSDMHQRLQGSEAGLIGYWPLASIEEVQQNARFSRRQVPALSAQAGPLQVRGDSLYVAADTGLDLRPAAGSQVVSTDYVTYGANRTAMMRRLLALPSLGGIRLLGHKRVEELELKWIGNVQMQPTLLGYIEGAPPVPSENLTVDPPAYQGASAISLHSSEEIKYSWRREQEAGLGMDLSAFLGLKVEVDNELVGKQALRGGLRANLDWSYSFIHQSEISTSTTTAISNALELRGHPEQEPRFPHLGRRFIPKNVGYALVISGVGDVFVSRLKRSRRMVAYHVQPAPGIPLDINTITFLINPAYTMNGSLDGLTGSQATSDRFYADVPRMRAQYGAYYPASFFRLREAYDRKRAIEQRDKERAQYFANYNANLVDETSLQREVGDSTEAPDPSLITGIVDRVRSESERQDEQAHRAASLAAWQEKLEGLQARAGKRNLVNTYVWDADGGLYAESEQILDTVEHTIGGSFALGIGVGFEGDFENLVPVLGVNVGWAGELSALFTIQLNQTMTKSVERGRTLSMEVDLSGVERLGVTDYKDRPYQPGEKVDRYRFMSFFLEGSTDHYEEFFNQVVDPEWLAGNDEEARALRQARGRKNKTWRVLHRVTHVERPALFNFGQDLRELTRQADPPMFFTEFGPLQEAVATLYDAHADHRRDLAQDLGELKETAEQLQQGNQQLESRLVEILNRLRNDEP